MDHEGTKKKERVLGPASVLINALHRMRSWGQAGKIKEKGNFNPAAELFSFFSPPGRFISATMGRSFHY
ncbi:MAG: hypothetical protein GY765_20540 [bacterium]|nr:hypothetical protein [bacterium]